MAIACLAALALPAAAAAEPLQLPSLTAPIVELPQVDGVLPDLPELPALPAFGAPAAGRGEGPLGLVPVLEALQFRWVTAYGPTTSAPLRREHAAVVGVPMPLDVGGSSSPDVLAELSLSGTQQVTMRITKLPLAAATLPLAIEAVAADPGGSDRNAAFGYDARDSTAPGTFTAVLGVTSRQGATQLGMDLTTSGAGATLAVTGEVFTPGAGGARLDPKRLRLAFDPVPATARLAAVAGAAGGAQRSTLQLGAGTPTIARLTAEDVQGPTVLGMDATVDRLPQLLTLGMTDEGGRRALSYDATGTVAALSARLVERRSGAVTRDLTLDMTGIPTRIDVVQDRPDHATVRASGAIGTLSAAVARGGSPRRLADPAYVHTYRDATLDSLAVRLQGLSRAEIGAGDPLLFDAAMKPGPFRALLVSGARRLEARARDLPGELRLAFFAAARRATYDGSAPVGEVTVDAYDPAGLAGRAKTLKLALRGVPTGLDVALGGEHDRAGLDARGKVLGSVDALLTSGPVETIATGEDGLKLRDLADRWLVAARITGLKKVALTQRPAPDLELDTTGGRIFRASLRQRRTNAPDQVIEAKVDRLAPATRVLVTDAPDGRKVTWTAGAPTGELTVAADGLPLTGRAKNLRLTLRGIPTLLTLNLGKEGAGADIDTGGRPLALIDALLTSGPGVAFDTSLDGLVLRDLADRYVLAARVTGLKRARVVQTPSPDVTLETTANRRLTLDVQQLESGKVVYTRALLDHLLASTRLQLVETPRGKRLLYNASGTANRLSFDTNDGDRWNLHGDLSGPLPSAFELCQADDASCGGSGRHAGAGSMRISASQHTTLNIFDCKRPLNANCNQPWTADAYTQASNLRVRHLAEDAHFSDFGERGHMYLDTDNHGLTGRVVVKDPSVGFDAYFPAGFRSQNRLGSWTLWGLFKSKSGSITCPYGTDLGVRVLGFRLGVNSYIC